MMWNERKSNTVDHLQVGMIGVLRDQLDSTEGEQFWHFFRFPWTTLIPTTVNT